MLLWHMHPIQSGGDMDADVVANTTILYEIDTTFDMCKSFLQLIIPVVS